MGHYKKEEEENTLEMLNDITNLCADISYVLYSITRKTLMELFDSVQNRINQYSKLKENFPNTNT